MEIYSSVIQFVDTNLIFILLPAIICLYAIEVAFRNKFKTRKALSLISYFIIFYTIITLLHFIVGSIIAAEDFAFTERATGRYAVIYWLMLVCATLLPFTLLIKRLASKYLYVLFILIFMKLGFYFERFVILVTSYNRDYSPYKHDFAWLNIPTLLAIFILRGLLMAIIILFLIKIICSIRFHRSQDDLHKAA